MSARIAAAGSAKTWLFGTKRTADSPVNLIVVCLRGLNCGVAGTGTDRTGSLV